MGVCKIMGCIFFERTIFVYVILEIKCYFLNVFSEKYLNGKIGVLKILSLV